MTSVESIPPILLGGVPVVQPPHLEGDSTLATEILPGPPSLLSLQQQGNRKDTKKPSASLSYLPVSDPGSTYSALAIGAGATTMMNSSNVDGPRRKRARTNKGASSARPQRASARVLNPSSAMTDMATSGHEAATAWSAQLQAPLQESSMPPSVVDGDELVFSRSNSADDIQFVSGPANGMGTKERTAAGRKDKGKGKEKEKPGHLLRVKEEPVAITFNQNDYGPPLPNEDHCSACQYLGSLVYCDGCPKAFHLWCLDPPMEPQDLPEGENRWFCPACVIQNNPTSKLPASLKFMSPLIHQLQCTMPSEFRLPDEIRTTFKDVATGPRGTYVDSSEIKPPRLNRHGQLEDRDPHRLKDRSGDPILCYQCGMSALPSTDIAPPPMKRPRRASNKLANTDTWTSMISCDYCDLNWHLDCLDPPVASMPTFGIKWMCPNHAEQVHKPKRRILKQNATPIEITKPNQPNNGNIEIINNIFSLQEEKVLVDEISINGRRYRVPERVVKLDFWNKVNGTQPIESSCESPLSSPLTPLSSLEDFDELPIKSQPTRLYSIDDIAAAQLLWSLQARAPSVMPVAPVALNGTLNSQDVNVDNQIPSRHHSPARHQTSPGPKKIKIDAQTTVEPTTSSKLVEPPTISMPPAAPREQPPLPQTRNGRRRSARKPAPSTKRVKVDLLDDTSSDSRSTSTASQPPKAAKAADNPFAVPKSVPSLQKSATSATTVDSNAKQNRPSTIEKPVNGNGKPVKAAPPAQSTTPPAPHVPKSTKTPSKKSLMITKTGKSVSSVAATPIKSESSTSPKPNSTTPSLKIRLPRLSDITSVSASTSTVTATASRTNSTGESGRGSIARRLSRRQTSTSTS